MVREGILTTVAKTGGLKLDNEQIWINPNAEVKKMITAGELNPEAMKTWLNKRVILDLDPNGYWLGVQVHADDDSLEEETVTPTIESSKTQTVDKSKFYINLGGKDYVTHAGLLNEAHNKGLNKIYTELIKEDPSLVIFKATAETKEGKLFSAYGDAAPNSVNKMIAPHIIRMAETRAINRALRLLTNIGMTSIDELGEQNKDEGESK